MNTGKIYYDLDGNECSILQMVKREPGWAASRVQVGEEAIEKVAELKAQLARCRGAYIELTNSDQVLEDNGSVSYVARADLMDKFESALNTDSAKLDAKILGLVKKWAAVRRDTHYADECEFENELLEAGLARNEAE